MRTVLCALILFLATVRGQGAFAGAPAEVPAAAPGHGTIRLVPRWVRGGGDDEVFFGDIQQVTLDGAGNLVVVDRQRGRVEVFAPDGTLARTVSLEGPGNARDDTVWLLPDGRVAV